MIYQIKRIHTMKRYILLFTFCWAINHLSHAQRLTVKGKISSDSLQVKTIKLRRGTGTQFLSGSGRPFSLGTGLSVSNGILNANVSSKPLIKSTFGPGPSFAAGYNNDTLFIPMASPISAGLLNDQRQEFAGHKLFQNPLNLTFRRGIVIENTSLLLPIYWFLNVNTSNEFNLLSGSAENNAKFNLSTNGQFIVSDLGNTGATASIYSNGSVEARYAFIKTGETSPKALAANGTARKFLLYDGIIYLSQNVKGYGLNTNQPSAFFEVKPTNAYNGNQMMRVTSNGNAAITVNNDGQSWVGLSFSRNNAEVRFFGMPGLAGGYDHLYTSGGDAINKYYLGINTISIPTEKIDVNGVVKANAISVGLGSATTLLSGNGTAVTLPGNFSVSSKSKTVMVNGSATTQSVNELNLISSVRSKISNITSTSATNTSIDCSVDYVLIGGSGLDNQNISISIPSPSTCRGKRIVIKNYIKNTSGNTSTGIVTVYFSPTGYFYLQNMGSTATTSLTLSSGTTKALVSDGTNWQGAGSRTNLVNL
jgi:hypothetical protein